MSGRDALDAIALAIVAALGLGVKEGVSEGGGETNAPRTPEHFEVLPPNAAGFSRCRSERDGSEWILVPAGPCFVGSTADDVDSAATVWAYDVALLRNELPVETIEVDAFWMQATEVSNARYREYLRSVQQAGGHLPTCPADEPAGHSHVPEYWSDGNPPPGTDDHPVVGVDWWDARAYAGWLGARLPTELEWEKAARWDERANRARRYPWGDPWNRSLSRTACEIAGKDLNGLTWPRWRESFPYSPHRPPTRPVGTYSAGASPFGILDLHGNVWEWCLDEYRPRRPGRSVALLEASTAVAAESPQVETTEGVEGSSDPSRLAKVLRTVRGGSWIDTGAVRAATRARRPQDARGGVLGFRCVATAEVDDASARTATPTTGSGG